MTISRLPVSPAMTRLKERVETIETEELVRIAERVEDSPTRSEAERILYAVVCTTLCRRLEVSCQEALESTFGPAAFLGVRAAFASA